MNQNEVNFLRRNFKVKNKNFYVRRMAAAHIDPNLEDKVVSFEMIDFENLQTPAQNFFLNRFKKGLSGRFGRTLMEYPIATQELQEDTPIHALAKMHEEALEDEKAVRDWVKSFANNVPYLCQTYLMISSCELLVDSQDPLRDPGAALQTHPYRFLMVDVCEMNTGRLSMIYNPDSHEIEESTSAELEIGQVLDGCLYPAFSQGYGALSELVVYSKKPAKPNEFFVSMLCGEREISNPDNQKKQFMQLVEQVAQEQLSVELIGQLHDNLRIMVEDNEDRDVFPLAKSEVRDLLEQSGVSEAKLQDFSRAYDDIIENSTLEPIRMMDPEKITIKIDKVTITARKEAAERISTAVVDGKLCLTILMDEGALIEGLDVIK